MLIGSHSASFIKYSLALCALSQLPIIDIAQIIGWIGREQNKRVEETAIRIQPPDYARI
jgi:hypothetical protein